jgi:thiamine transport system permease protein
VGLCLLAGIAGVILAALLALALKGTGTPLSLSDPYFVSVLKFTLWQAALSSALSCGLAIPVARAFHRHPDFVGRALLLRLFNLPLVMPAIVVALAILSLFGRAGWISQALGLLGLPPLNPYGLSGILLAHCFFNLPLASRILLTVLETIPPEQERLARQLGLSAMTRFRLVELPALTRALPGLLLLIFLICTGSFTIVLALGGGPAASTLEVAVYEALRTSFDPGRAAQLALVQLALTITCLLLARRFAAPWVTERSHHRPLSVPEEAGRLAKLADITLIVLSSTFLLLPLLAMLLDGLRGPLPALLADEEVHRALLRTLMLALMAGPLATAFAWGLLTAARASRGRMRNVLTDGGDLMLTVPPVVLGTGWFLVLRPLTAPEEIRFALLVVLNALMVLPYVLRSLGPALMQAGEAHNRLCASLGISGWTRFRLIDLPVLSRPLALALGMAAALAAGDFAAVALMGADASDALPLLLHSRMGSYRLNDAAALAVILTSVGFLLLWLADLGGRRLGRRHSS